MRNNLIAIRQIDSQLADLKSQKLKIPFGQSWVRTIRKALGMTIVQLAKKLGVDPSRVVKIETSEIEGAITLKTLKVVAEQLNCELVYGFIPKTSLEQTVNLQAEKIARTQVEATCHTMELEAQGIDSKQWIDRQTQELAEELLRKHWKYLWEDK